MKQEEGWTKGRGSYGLSAYSSQVCPWSVKLETRQRSEGWTKGRRSCGLSAYLSQVCPWLGMLETRRRLDYGQTVLQSKRLLKPSLPWSVKLETRRQSEGWTKGRRSCGLSAYLSQVCPWSGKLETRRRLDYGQTVLQSKRLLKPSLPWSVKLETRRQSEGWTKGRRSYGLTFYLSQVVLRSKFLLKPSPCPLEWQVSCLWSDPLTI